MFPLEVTSRTWMFEPLPRKVGAQPPTAERASSGVNRASELPFEAFDAGRLQPERRRYAFRRAAGHRLRSFGRNYASKGLGTDLP